jgi:hypothetical protein
MDCAEDHEQVLFIKNEMEEALALEQQQPKFSFKGALKDQTDLKPLRRLVLCFMVQMFQQFTGINVIAFYGMQPQPPFLACNLCAGGKTANRMSSDDCPGAECRPLQRHQQPRGWFHPNGLLGRHNSAHLVGCRMPYLVHRRLNADQSTPVLSYLDKVGRRPVLLAGSTVLLLTLILFTVGVAVNTSASSNLALAMLILFQITFGMSWNAIPWIYAPEITPLQLRHVGSAVGPFSEWMWTFVSDPHDCRNVAMTATAC